MKSIEELQADVKKLYQELEERKRIEQAAAPQAVNFREISAKAKRYAIQGHPMAECDEHTQQMYLLVLLSVAALDDTAYVDSFCTIYRIAHGMHYAGDVQELFLSAQQMNFDKLDECTRLFLGNEKRLLLLLECMLVAGTFDAGRKQAMAYLAQLCVLMQMTKEETTFLSHLARVVLTQDIQQYHWDYTLRCGTLFDCYLNMLEDQIKIEILTHDNISDYTRDTCMSTEEMMEVKLESINRKERVIKYSINSFYLLSVDEVDFKLVYPKDFFLIKHIESFMIDSRESVPLAVVINTPLAYDRAVDLFDKQIKEFFHECQNCGSLISTSSITYCPKCGKKFD